MNKDEFYKTYIANLKNNCSEFNVLEQSIKRNKFLQIKKETPDRYLQAKMHVSMSHNFMKDCLAWISFKEVETPITKIFIENKILASGAGAKDIWHPTLPNFGYKSFHPFEQRPYYFKVKEVTTEKEAKLENQMIIDYWQKLIIPFFNYFTHLHNLIPYIQEEEKISEKLNPIGGLQRKLIIWYLCDHPEYENYKLKILKLIKENQTNQRSANLLKATLQIIEYLEKRNPIYQWDPEYLIKKPIPAIIEEFKLDNYKFVEEKKASAKWRISRFWTRKK